MGMQFSRYALTASAAAALLTGCGALSFGSAQGRLAQGDMQPPVVATRAVERNTTSSYGVLYRFGGHPDGQQPQGALLNVNGTLYGTTYERGRACNKRGGPGCGTVYSIDTSGTEKVLYRFQGDSDGTGPRAGLIDVNGTLYGTTSSGGFNKGTVYSISTSGTEKVLYAFRGRSDDGEEPASSLIDVKGTLYGTTPIGG